MEELMKTKIRLFAGGAQTMKGILSFGIFIAMLMTSGVNGQLTAQVQVTPVSASTGPAVLEDDHRVREAGPEDGFLCCNGFTSFLFRGDEVLTSTGRAGVFWSEQRGERWHRSMQGLVGPNGVSGFVT
jgi:hypothetical protein